MPLCHHIIIIPICVGPIRTVLHNANMSSCVTVCSCKYDFTMCNNVYVYTVLYLLYNFNVCVYVGRVYRGYVELYCITTTVIAMLCLGDIVTSSLGDCTGGDYHT